MTLRMVVDLETRADISVVDVGPHKYAADPSNEILCAGWRVNDGSPAKVAIFVGGSEGRAAVERRVRDAGRCVTSRDEFIFDWRRADVKVAHNVEFEICELDRHFGPFFDAPNQHWSCTAARSRRLGLPGGLGDVCRVLRTPHQKSEAGHATMLQVSQPRPVWRNNPAAQKWFDDADRLARTAIYCVDDILAECDLDVYLPELPPQERLYWEQTTRCNHRGIRLDGDLIDAMSRVIERSSAAVMGEVRRVAGSDFELTNVNAIKAFCADRGVPLDDLRAATVEAKLAAHRSGARKLPEAVAVVLEGRQQSGGKSSNSKLTTMRDRMGEGGRTRDTTIYHGAHTGRTTGSGINVLNLPRPYKGFDQDFVIECLLSGKLKELRDEQKVSPAVAVSAAIRGTIIPSDGHRFVIGDYSSVEPCCLFTLAHQWDAVETLRNKNNIYIEFGKVLYGRTLDKNNDLAQYTICKNTILGCGYGIGPDKFLAKLREGGSDAPEAEIRKAHALYREKYSGVVRLWNGIGEAMKQAIRLSGRVFAYNEISFSCDGYWLLCHLPSGRALYYPNARLQPGKYSDEVVYEGWMRIDGRPAGWGDVRTWGARAVENVCQSICRDIMAEDELEVEALPGWNMTMTVYDELVAECPDSLAPGEGLKTLLGIMSQPPRWLPAMPVRAEGFEATRYRKD